MANKLLTVQAPKGGISRRASYQTQEPFMCYDSLNYWPIDVKTGRITSAIRPPLKLFGSLETEVNMLSLVNGIRASHPAKSFAAAYEGTIYYWNGSTMVSATGAQAAAVDTGNYVSAAPVIDKLVICDSTLAPIAFDYTDGTAATIVASAGSVPTGSTIAVNWQGALWLANDSILYASRPGDITDWDFSVPLDDLFGAFYTDGSYKGVIAGPITAVMPQTADVMLVSTVSGTLAMRGHPRQGGVFEPVSSSYVMGQGAWCQIADGSLIMMTPLGVMSLAPEPGATFAPLSRERIPDELIGLTYDRDDPLINLQYNSRWNCVHIFVRGGQEQAWIFDLNTGGFHREEISSYPFTTCEFNDFNTESVSGVLLGRYNGIYNYDRFATETIVGSIVAGPVKISQSPMHASKIKNVRVTMARDTPSEGAVGTFKIAAGLDGQDAVARLLNGEEQYSIPLSALESSYGMCYPDVAGHAAVFAFSTETGDLAIEEIAVNVAQMGSLSMNRSTQIATTGEASEFSGAFVEFDNSAWSGYSLATPTSAPSAHLQDYTHFLDLSLMPQSWWDEAKGATGEDVRVTDVNDNEKAATLVDYSLTGQTGMLCFNMTQPTSPKAVRVWTGSDRASHPDVDDTYGQYNVFDDYWRAFWPDGGGLRELTQYGDNTETYNYANDVPDDFDQYYGGVPGPMGATASDWNQSAGNERTGWGITNWFVDHELTTHKEWTLVSCVYRTGAPVLNDTTINMYANLTEYTILNCESAGGAARTSLTSVDASTATARTVTGGASMNTWHHHAGTTSGTQDRAAWLDGGSKAVDIINSEDPEYETLHCPYIDYSFPAHVSMMQIHTVARSDAWVEYQGAMLDQVTFWGVVGDFNLVNPDIPDSLLTTACPTGSVPQVEAGTTDGYATLTPVDPSDGTVVKFSLIVDLSILPAGWWTQAVASGKNGLDIRATLVDNTILPIDLIEIDTAASTGLAIVRTNQNKGDPSAIRLWVGNASAITLDSCNLTGRFTAYDTFWRGYWPSGSGTDRTMYANDMTSTGSPSVDALASQTGSQATTFVNDAGTADMYATATNLVPAENPLTLMASVKRPSGSINNDAVIMAVQDSDSAGAVLLRTRPSSTPARTTTRNAYGTEASAGNSAAVVPTSWWFQAGTSFGNHTRISYVDGNTGSSTSGQDTVVVSSLDRITIAAEYATTMTRELEGTVAHAGLHATPRGTAWLNYWNKSLTQGTFWAVGSWTADPTALS